MSKTQLKQNSIVGLDCNKNKGIHETAHFFLIELRSFEEIIHNALGNIKPFLFLNS